jgi:hypothetical protein
MERHDRFNHSPFLIETQTHIVPWLETVSNQTKPNPPSNAEATILDRADRLPALKEETQKAFQCFHRSIHCTNSGGALIPVDLWGRADRFNKSERPIWGRAPKTNLCDVMASVRKI